MKQSDKDSCQGKRDLIDIIANNRGVFEKETLDKKECYETYKKLCAGVEASIDKLVVIKDSLAYTFKYSLKAALDKYFDAVNTNPKEQAKYDKSKAQWDRLNAKGKTPDWKVTPPAIIDLELTRKNILMILDRLVEKYENALADTGYDYEQGALNLIEFFKEKARGVVDVVTPARARAKALKLMEEVGIPDPAARFKQYPFEFSGGMRQRIVIAIALAANPDILICDEPTTALDVTIQAQILELINRIKAERNLSIIFITHDLGVVANMADRIAVMYAGKIVEYGTDKDIFYNPKHPYTWALLASMPDLETKEKLEAIPGTPPNMIFPPVGDAFAARNKHALQIDFEQQPPLFKINDDHYAATWLLHPDAPKVEPPRIVTQRIERMKAKSASLQQVKPVEVAVEKPAKKAPAKKAPAKKTTKKTKEGGDQ
ncbi:MAG: ATP-binding cassette domain-containing protein [Clostridia bacterium]|nr:ATP-binding cassette domain-containing protein [Clostridia bacterium]